MDIESLVLDILNGAGAFNFNIVIYGFLVSLGLIWLFTTFWVWNDSGDRTTNILFRLFSVLLVLPFNIPGLIIYLIIRPRDTIEGIYWSDLERRYLMYETSELGDCAECGYQLRPGFNVCPNCAFALKKECSSCNVMIDKNWKFCPYCVNTLGLVTDKELASLERRGLLRTDSKLMSLHERESSDKDNTKSEEMSEDSISSNKQNAVKEQYDNDSSKTDVNHDNLLEETESEKSIEPTGINEEPPLPKIRLPKADLETPSEDQISKEEMDRRVQESREHMVHTVENVGTRYKVSSGVSVKLGRAVMKSVVGFGAKVDSFFKGIGSIFTSREIEESIERTTVRVDELDSDAPVPSINVESETTSESGTKEGNTAKSDTLTVAPKEKDSERTEVTSNNEKPAILQEVTEAEERDVKRKNKKRKRRRR